MSVFVGSIVLLGLGGVADAKVIGSGSNPSNFSFSAATANVPIAAGTAAPTVLNVAAPRRGSYVLTFSAECSVDAPAGNSSAWIDIDVVVNGTTVSPTVGTGDAFCGANGTVGFDGWVRPSISVAVDLIKGLNVISILARRDAGATAGWLSDSSIVVHD